MKRILLSLAAVAALASCVKENNLEPTAGQLTISAVSADSKTLLNGFDVVWEKTDKIAVVVSDGTTAEFSAVESTVNGSEADFVGTVSTDWADVTSAYAVYPAAAAGKTHTLPAEQTGDVSGLMLSTAVLDVEDLQKGASKAEFYNALTLLQVVVPEGVQEVKFSADMYSSLVGKVDFSVDAATGAVTFTKTNATRYLTLKAAEGLEAKSYSLLVYPGKVNELTLHMVGLDGAEYTNTVADLEFVAGEYRTINLYNIFNIEPKESYVVLPAGGMVEIPVVTAGATEYKVSLSSGAESWLSQVTTKGFHKETLVFEAKENTTGNDREATVTVTWGGDKSKSFKVEQKNVFMDFVNDLDGNPIQWQETFGVYSSEDDAIAGTGAIKNYKNVFTIALSDDFSKGTYKITNMFVFNHATNGKIYGTYYADYTDGKLVVKDNDASPYYFSGDIELAYDSVEKSFTASAPIGVGQNTLSVDLPNRKGYIGGYAAAVKVEEPEVGGSFDVTSLYGTYNELVSAPYSYNAPETLLVTASDDSSYDLKMLFFYTEGQTSHDTGYGKVSADGKTITVTIPGNSSFYGPVSDFTLTFEDGVISGSYCGNMDYSAENPNYVAPGAGTEPEPFDVTSLYGTYNELVSAPYSYNAPETLLVTASDDSSYDLKMLFFYTEGQTSHDTGYGKVSADGKTITVTIPGNSSFYGPVSDFTLTFEDGVISGSYCGNMDYSAENSDYVAPGAGTEPEPEQPTRQPNNSWENAAVVVNDGTDQKYGKFFKELKVYADENNMYIRLTMEKQDAYYVDNAFKSNKLDMFLANGEGDPADEATVMWWGWTTRQTAKYDEEHKGDMANGVLTKMRFYQNPGSEEGKVYVDFEYNEVDGNYVYNFTYKREWIAPYVSSEGNIYVAYRLWNDWGEYWVIPQTGQPMLEVVLP